MRLGNKFSAMEIRSFYDEAMRLRREMGWGKRRIARKLGLSENTVRFWLGGRQPFHTNVNLSPSPELSFFLGCMYSDGTAYFNKPSGNWILSMTSTDKEFLEKFSLCSSRIVGRENPYPILLPPSCRGRQGWRDAYIVSFNCRTLVEFLGKRVLEERHIKVIDEYPPEFIQAFFDGDGTVYGDNYLGIILRVSNKKKQVIRYIADLLQRKFKISTSVYEMKNPNKMCACQFRGLEKAIKFYREIGFTINRKNARLGELIENKIQKTELRA
ncbi:hypothetical protein ES706_02353 [subsurface metagenome]